MIETIDRVLGEEWKVWLRVKRMANERALSVTELMDRLLWLEAFGVRNPE